MRQFDTIRGSLPAPTSAGPGYSSYRGSPKVAFLSQLIAERHHMAPQRVKRQAPVGEALRTYDAGGKIAVRRLPPGYRMSIDA
jgi:hypothetical protein